MKSNWEAFHAQFELAAQASGWSREVVKAPKLALFLTEIALVRLLLLSPKERQDYEALTGALQRHFGKCVLRSERCDRRRKPD